MKKANAKTTSIRQLANIIGESESSVRYLIGLGENPVVKYRHTLFAKGFSWEEIFNLTEEFQPLTNIPKETVASKKRRLCFRPTVSKERVNLTIDNDSLIRINKMPARVRDRVSAWITIISKAQDSGVADAGQTSKTLSNFCKYESERSGVYL
jgi:hypothetical protein